MDNNDLKNRYQSKVKLLEELRVIAKYYLITEIGKKKIKIHSLEDRIKMFDSLLDKMKKQKTKEPFREIKDLLGLRIVCFAQIFAPSVPSLEIYSKSLKRTTR